MGKLSYKRNTVGCMASALGIVMRFGMGVRVGDRRAVNNVNMGKQSYIRVVRYEKYCEYKCACLFCSIHKLKSGAKIVDFFDLKSQQSIFF